MKTPGAAPVRPLAPYGTTAWEYLQDAQRNPVPAGFRPGRPERAREFDAWITGIGAELGRVAWPRHDPARGDWIREDAAWGRKEDLTAADLDGIAALQPLLDQPASPARAVHRDFFGAEDQGLFGTLHREQYDATFPLMAQRVLPALIHRGLSDCLGSAVVQLKERFQRPRAWQVGFHGRHAAIYRLATRSADHPAFISGHAAQGLVGTMHAYLALKRLGYTLDAAQRLALARLATHIGDRRVMAGVHYPSDSVGAWIVVLSVLEHVVEAAELADARAFVTDAIRESPVHALLGSRTPSPFDGMRELLGSLMATGHPVHGCDPRAAAPRAGR